MARPGALRGVLGAWLGLVVLWKAGQTESTSRIVELLGDVDRVVRRALDANVPAIPDLRNGETWGTGVGDVGAAAKNLGTAAPGTYYRIPVN